MRKSNFADALGEWLADTPVGMEKPVGSVGFGRQFYVAILDEYYELGASADEALKLCGREVEAHVFALGIVDDHAHERLWTDRRINEPSADPDLLCGLGNTNFLHALASHGDSAHATIAEGGAAAHIGLKSRCRVPGGSC